MARKTLVKLLALLILCEVLLVSVNDAKPWWRRRRSGRRRCSSSIPAGVAWENSWRAYFSDYCPSSYSIKYWRSEHRNCQEDRIHYFQCGYGPVPYTYGNCAWSGHYVNDFHQAVDFKCPHDGFIAGVRSTYGHSDRRFNFRCCHKNGFIAHSCQTTLYQNNLDQPVYYWVPYSYYLVGVSSYYNNGAKDRRWKFDVCKFRRLSGK